MAYKRLIAMVPVLRGQVVLSFGYLRHQPAGKLDTVLKNLDRWNVDEIVLIDITPDLTQPDYRLLDQIRMSSVRTPVAFGGGIRNAGHALRVIELGCDRVVVETLLWESLAEIASISAAIGQQAVIGVAPLVMLPAGLHAQRAGHDVCVPWREFESRIVNASISELMLVDRAHEGLPSSHRISEHVPIRAAGPKIIWFGGIGDDQAASLLGRHDTVGVAVGNAFLRRELAAWHLRQRIQATTRPPLVRGVKPHAGH